MVYLLSLVVQVVFYNSFRTRHASIGFSTQRVGFFHDEIEIPERVTVLVIILSESLLTSRIIAHSVKNSIELLSQQWGFYGFCLKTNLQDRHSFLQKKDPVTLYLVTLSLKTWFLSPTRPVVKGA